MITLQTEIEGKRAYFGETRDLLRQFGYTLCGNWEYDKGKFDTVLWREQGETIYLRIPFRVLHGQLDNHDAFIEFRTPYVIKHVVNLGLDWDENSLLSATGFNQFQKPLDTDGQINHKSKWEEVGLRAVEEVFRTIRVS